MVTPGVSIIWGGITDNATSITEKGVLFSWLISFKNVFNLQSLLPTN